MLHYHTPFINRVEIKPSGKMSVVYENQQKCAFASPRTAAAVLVKVHIWCCLVDNAHVVRFAVLN